MTRHPLDSSHPALMASLRDLCLTYPQTTEDIKWENPVFLVHERIFVLVSQRDEGRVGLWLKAGKGVQEAFVGADPERYYRPPYLGPKGWLGAWISPESQPIWPVIEDLIDESFRLVAPKRVVALLGPKPSSR
jgi:hypothetical protein